MIELAIDRCARVLRLTIEGPPPADVGQRIMAGLQARGLTWSAAAGVAERLELGWPAYLPADADVPVIDGVRISKAIVATPRRLTSTSSDVTRAWKGLVGATSASGLDALLDLRSPALADDVRRVEAMLGRELPAGFKAWLSLHDGGGAGEAGGPLPWALMPLASAAREKLSSDAMYKTLPGGAVYTADEGVRAVAWDERWFPIGQNGAGDLLCLDLRPAKGGEIGQIIVVRHDDDHRRKLAASFAAWLESLREGIASGEYVIKAFGIRSRPAAERTAKLAARTRAHEKSTAQPRAAAKRATATATRRARKPKA